MTLTAHDTEQRPAAVDLVTRSCGPASIYDYRGDVIDMHAPEDPDSAHRQVTQVKARRR